MPLLRLFAALLCTTSAAATAQQLGEVTTTEQKDVGQLKVRIETYKQALGVISQLSRFSFAQTVECTGICYFANFSKSTTWACAPGKTCNLRCMEAPPRGDCN